MKKHSLMLPSYARLCLSVLWRSVSRSLSPIELAASAVTFSPHQDDETLGCGGTLVQKRKSGASLQIVYMTDGSASHRSFMTEPELSAMRHREALSACRVIGVEPANVKFLGFRDGDLWKHRDEAVEQVGAILREGKFEQVFVPYEGDTTPDHRATHSIVMAALYGLDRPVTVYEYPVWFWMHWPWTSAGSFGSGRFLRDCVRTVWCWSRLLTELRWFVPVSDVLDQKRAALSQHRSQTERLFANTDWPILSDVANGQFLNCFFQGQEVFYRHRTTLREFRGVSGA